MASFTILNDEQRVATGWGWFALASKNHPIEKENHLPNPPFLGSLHCWCVFFFFPPFFRLRRCDLVLPLIPSLMPCWLPLASDAPWTDDYGCNLLRDRHEVDGQSFLFVFFLPNWIRGVLWCWLGDGSNRIHKTANRKCFKFDQSITFFGGHGPLDFTDLAILRFDNITDRVVYTSSTLL